MLPPTSPLDGLQEACSSSQRQRSVSTVIMPLRHRQDAVQRLYQDSFVGRAVCETGRYENAGFCQIVGITLSYTRPQGTACDRIIKHKAPSPVIICNKTDHNQKDKAARKQFAHRLSGPFRE